MTKRLFTSKEVKAKECMELVDTNVCGPFNVQARGGYEYFVAFTDDYSSMVMLTLCIGNPMS